MQIVSSGTVAIADAGAAHCRTIAGASTGIEDVRIVGVGPDAILETPDILVPECNA